MKIYDWKNKTDDQIVKIITGNQKRLEARKQVYDNLHSLIIKVFRPRRHDILRRDITKKGKQFGAQVYDQGPANALNKFVNGKLGYMVNRSVPWIQFTASDIKLSYNDAVKKYCQEAREQVLSAANRSTLYESLVPHMLDADSIGTSVMVPMTDEKKDRVVFDVVHPRDSFIGVDQLKLTRMTAEEMFSQDKLPAGWYKPKGDKHLKDPFHEDEYLWALYPNGDRDNSSSRSEDKPWLVMVIHRGGTKKKGKLVYKKGRDRFVICCRTGRESGAEYGTSVAADCLTAALVVNKLGEKALGAAHIITEPPVIASATLRGHLESQPGGRTYVADIQREGVKTWMDRIAWPITDVQMDRLHAQIEDRMFIKFFEMLSAGDMKARTAYEISQMMSEKAVLMSAVIDTLEQETLEPSIVELMWHEADAGRMPDPPEELIISGGAVDIIYLGPLAQLQRALLRGKGTVDALSIIGQMIEMQPTVGLKFDWLEMAEDVAISQGMPQKHILGDAEVDALLQEQARKQQMAEEMAMAEQAGKAAGGLSKAPEEGSPAEALMGGLEA